MIRPLLACLALGGVLANISAEEPAATFRILYTNTPSTAPTHKIVGCSADGSILAGTTESYTGFTHLSTSPFRVVGDATEPLGYLAGLTASSFGYASAISADGQTIVGNSVTKVGLVAAPGEILGGAFRWTAATGMQPLFDLTRSNTSAVGVSADGSVIIGNESVLFSQATATAFRWTAAGVVALPPLPGDTGATVAGLSGDGTLAVGTSHGKNGDQACTWSADGTVTPLGFLPNSNPVQIAIRFESTAVAISADGTTVIGRSVAVHPEGRSGAGFRWTAAGGMQPLFGDPEAVSADGSVIVGSWGGDLFRWDAVRGQQSLSALLLAGGADLKNYRLDHLNAMSADGKTFYGPAQWDYGQGTVVITGPVTKYEWVATLPVVPDLPDPEQTVNSSPRTPAPVIVKAHAGKPPRGDSVRRIVVRGQAMGSVSRITYRIHGSGIVREAEGTNSWRFSFRPEPGRSVVTIAAHGPGGSSKKVRVVITRK